MRTRKQKKGIKRLQAANIKLKPKPKEINRKMENEKPHRHQPTNQPASLEEIQSNEQ